MAMITDYDCWKVEEEPVTAQTVIAHLIANAETAKKILAAVIPRIPTEPELAGASRARRRARHRPYALARRDPGETAAYPRTFRFSAHRVRRRETSSCWRRRKI